MKKKKTILILIIISIVLTACAVTITKINGSDNKVTPNTLENDKEIQIRSEKKKEFYLDTIR